MSSFRNPCLMLAMGLALAGTPLVATTAPVNLSTDNSQVHDSSQEIAEAQAILQHAGYLAAGDYRKGEADRATVLAIRNFQTAHTLRSTGSIDYETTTQLLSHAGTSRSGTQLSSLFEGRQRLVLEGVTFDDDTARLRPGSRVTLDRVAGSLNARPEARVSIDGHTDSRNTDGYNLKLSRARSAAVSEYLVDHGVASWRLQERGYGESRPIADNATATGRASNRRVEITRVD